MTIDELKYFLNIAEDDEQYDEVIESLYALAKKMFYQNTRVSVEPTTFTDTYPRFNGNTIYLYQTPVTEIIETYMFTDVDDARSATPPFRRIDDALYFDEYFSGQTIYVTYKAGHRTIPGPIDQILAQLVSFLWNYDATKVFISGGAEGVLMPKDIEIPKHIRDNMAIYRVGI
jgi:hypothetical protein